MPVRIQRDPARRGVYTLQTEMWLPRDIASVFEFFSDAWRLEDITPPWLHFQVLTPRPAPIQAGTLLDYRLRLHGIPLRWRSEISVWEPPGRFVDRQVRGPYRLWRHEHRFLERDGGTLVQDLVDYSTPGGALLHWLWVRRDLDRIFRFRQARLRELLGTPAGPVGAAP